MRRFSFFSRKEIIPLLFEWKNVSFLEEEKCISVSKKGEENHPLILPSARKFSFLSLREEKLFPDVKAR